MPIYNFVCEDCDNIVQEFFNRSDEKTPPICECSGKMEITFRAMNSLGGGHKERVSTALGVHVSQIQDGSVFKVHPGARFNHNGDMILKDLGEQKKRLKERNWVDKNEGKGWY